MKQLSFTVAPGSILPLIDELAERVARVVCEQLEMAERDLAPWLTVKSAAVYLDTTEEAIRALIKRHEIPCYRTPNGRVLLDRRELNAWVRRDGCA